MSTTIPKNRLDTDVLIVGAGPTGLALATMLMRSGIAHVIVDKLATGQNTSRAAVVHAHTLEVLEQLGVSEREGGHWGRSFCLLFWVGNSTSSSQIREVVPGLVEI